MTSLILVISIALLIGCEGQYAPTGLYYSSWVKWQELIQTYHLTNMTHELVRDTMTKLWLANKIQENYKDNMYYELGLIASGIKYKFTRMLQLYRQHTDPDRGFFIDKWWQGDYVEKFQNAYFMMKSDYHELTFEIDMFKEAMKKHHRILAQKAKNLAKKKYHQQVSEQLKSISTAKRRRRGGDIIPRAFITGGGDQSTSDRVANGTNDEIYKKNLRYEHWAKKWNNFDPLIEGVDIDIE